MAKRKVEDSVTIMSQLMMPNDANTSGKVHGGSILSIVDKIAAVTAARHCRKDVVTAAIDRVNFLKPVEVGELLILKASVNRVGKTSMEVGVRVEAENLKTGKIRHTNSCYVTMVAIDKKGKSTKVPALVCSTKDQKRRCNDAELRKKAILKHFGRKR
jgi:uncharacterized protein (TIGR00369 family)